MPKVSVIMPVYNAEKYLRQCLDSVIGQTLRDIEIICVNDGSTDGSLAILEEYAKKDLRIIVINQKNQGPGASRNRALEIAKSEYIYFVDSDDWIEADACEIFVNIIEREDVELVIGDVIVNVENTTEDDYYISRRKTATMQHYDFCRHSQGKHKFRGDFMKYRISVWGKLYKKSIIDKYNFKFPAEQRVHEDDAWHWYYLSVIKSIYFVDKPLYSRAIHDGSLTYNLEAKNERIFDLLHVLKNIYDYLIDNNIYNKYKREYKNFFIRKRKTLMYICDNSCKQDVVSKLKELEKMVNINADLGANKRLSTKILEKIFCIKNDGAYKVISFFGLKIKAIKRLKK
jgi:glycosyltransferase involved in cell wall biosynthesis